MPHVKRATVEYVGTAYAGWQVQDNGPSVQAEIERALSAMYQTDIRTIGSGRTDAGVHALGQVISWSADRHFANYRLERGLNSMLPGDIRIIEVADAPDDFHAIRSAVRKTYCYKLLARVAPSALLADRAWWLRQEIDERDLLRLMEAFVGEFDFASFCKMKSLREKTVRKVEAVSVTRTGSVLDVRITATGFLHTMCRVMVGTAVQALEEGRDPGWIRDVILARDRGAAGKTAPAHGLYLERVEYPNGSVSPPSA